MNKNIVEAVKVLRKGGVVAYPTDTAYGLAVDATNVVAVKKLYRLKGRDFNKPVHVIPPSKVWIEKIVKLSPQAKLLIENLMPGPVTFVLPLKASGPSWKMLTASTKTMGIRRPKNKLALDLVFMFGKPITTTSANVSGQDNTYSVAQIQKQFAKAQYKPDFYLDGGKLKKTKPSTVVWLTNNHVKILRQGPVSEKEIKRVLK